MGRLAKLQRRLFGPGLKGEPEEMPAKPFQLREQLDRMITARSSKLSPPWAEEEGSCPRMSHSQPIVDAARVLTNEEEATDWLEICADKVGLVIRDLSECPHSSRSPQAAEDGHLCGKCLSIATNLAAIKTGLKEVVGLDSDEDFYKRVDRLLEVLDDMCVIQTKGKLRSPEQPMKDRFPGLWILVKNERRKELNQDGARNDYNSQAERLTKSIFNYLKEPDDILEILKQRIIDFFPNNGWERDCEETESEDHAAAQKALFQALAKYTPCGICKQQDPKDPPSWHPARLFLMKLKSKEDLVRFDVITSSTINGSWEDLCIEVPACVGSSTQPSILQPNKSRVRFANETGPDRTSRDSTGVDDTPLDSFCKIFQDNNGCRVSLRLHGRDLFWSRAEVLIHKPSPGSGMSLSNVLCQFKLTIREKFALAYIIALSFWQFYSSELMHRVWSSETIWFMPQEDGQREPKKVPLKAYVSFHPDATECDGDASECINRIQLIHKYPRIQSLGILLLEIGLGEPLCTPSSDSQNQRLNNRHMDALKKLKELENHRWDINSQYLEAFVRAIRNCLEFNADLNTSMSDLSRRKWLHQRVVAVLGYPARLFPTIDNKPLGSALAYGSHGPVNQCVPVAADINPKLDHASDNGSKHAISIQREEPRSPTSGEDFEIAIFCALPLEADAIKALFDHSWGGDDPCYHKSDSDDNAYSTGSLGRHNIVLIHMGRMGKVHAASAASSCKATFPNIKLAVVVGICGAVPLPPGRNEIILGDVIVSEGIVQYDFGRQFTKSFESKVTLLDSLPRPNNQIANFLAKLKTDKGKATLHDKMHGYLNTLQQLPKLEACHPGTNLDILFDGEYEHQDRALPCKEAGCCGQTVSRNRLISGTPKPAVHIGLFASGDKVMKSGAHRDALAQQEGILGLEMEGAGVWETIPCIVIKSACDYADSHKTKAFQRYSAATAASCTKAFLDEWV